MASRRWLHALIGIGLLASACAAPAAPTSDRAQAVAARPATETKVITIGLDDPVEQAVSLMERHQIRRLPVVDAAGSCVGMLAQADIAWKAEESAGELVREVSRDTGVESR